MDETAPMDESDETWHPTISDGQGSVDAKKVGNRPFDMQQRQSGRSPRLGVKQAPDILLFVVSSLIS